MMCKGMKEIGIELFELLSTTVYSKVSKPSGSCRVTNVTSFCIPGRSLEQSLDKKSPRVNLSGWL